MGLIFEISRDIPQDKGVGFWNHGVWIIEVMVHWVSVSTDKGFKLQNPEIGCWIITNWCSCKLSQTMLVSAMVFVSNYDP